MRLAKSTLVVHSSRVHARVCGVCLRRLFGVTPLKCFRLDYTLAVSILTRFSLSFNTTLLLTLLVVEQEIVLSAAVGHLLFGLDTNVRVSKKTAPFLFRWSFPICVICVTYFFHSRMPRTNPRNPLQKQAQTAVHFDIVANSTHHPPTYATKPNNVVTYYLTHEYTTNTGSLRTPPPSLSMRQCRKPQRTIHPRTTKLHKCRYVLPYSFTTIKSG